MNPFITILGLSCSSTSPVRTSNPPPPVEAPLPPPKTDEASQGTAEPETTANEAATPENLLMSNPPPQENIPMVTHNPPPINVPQPPPTPLNSLPRWDDVPPPEDLPPGTPTAGLALSHDYKICTKEWFAERSVHPHVRRYGGRVLLPDEKSSGTQILCSEAEKTTVLSKLRAAGIIPAETP